MEELRNSLFKLINEAGNNLPPEAIYYICKDFYRDVQEEYQKYLNTAAHSKAAQTEVKEDDDGE